MAAGDVHAEQKPLQAAALDEGKADIQDTEHVAIEKIAEEKQLPIVEEVKDDGPLGGNENDLNALDYEADKDDNMDEPETAITVQRVEIQQHKSNEKSSKSERHGDEKSSKRNNDTKKVDRRRRSRSRDKRSRDRNRRHSSRGRNDRRVHSRRRDHSPYSRDKRRDARRPSYERHRRNRDTSR